MLEPGWHQVELDGVTQAYEVAGEGPVCFVHSGGPGIESDYLRMPLLERETTLVHLDPVGTGKSGFLPDGDYSVPEYARRLELLRDHLGVTSGFLLGHSHGGFVALQYALDYPGRLRGIIVYDGTPTNTSEQREEARWQMAAFGKRWPERPEAVAAVREFLKPRAVNDRDSFQEYMDTITPAYFADYRQTTEELGKPPRITISGYDPARKEPPGRGYKWDVRGRLGDIETPTLVLVGTYDFMCPPRWAEEMHAGIPGSQLVEFTESGHFPHLEQPEDFALSVRKFLRE